MKKLLLSILGFTALSMLSLNHITTQKKSHSVKYNLGLPFAKAGTNVNCDIVIQSSFAGEPTPGTYSNHVLDRVHDQLYRFNNMESADIEMVFCQMVNRFGFNPDLSQLPQSLSFSIGGGLHTFSLDVTAPAEAFAATLGYEAKAVLKYDGTIFVTMWWSGNSDASKGYLIQNLNPLAADGYKRIKYAQWDRTGVVQTVKVYTANFKTAYLSQPNYTNTVDSSKLGGDRAHFGRATYNSSTHVISAQSIEIHQNFSNANAFACYKIQIAGTIGGTLSAYRPALEVPESPTSNTTDGTNIDGVTGVVDSKTTADGSGTVVSAPASLPVAFDYSCSNLNNAASGGVFNSNTVNYNLAPSSVFPN